MDEVIADPSLGRVGIYIGESSRSITERATEHFNDGESFTKGSHIVYNWMKTHSELEAAPQLKITILRRYKDCLSRHYSSHVNNVMNISFVSKHFKYTGPLNINIKNESNKKRTVSADGSILN